MKTDLKELELQSLDRISGLHENVADLHKNEDVLQEEIGGPKNTLNWQLQLPVGVVIVISVHNCVMSSQSAGLDWLPLFHLSTGPNRFPPWGAKGLNCPVPQAIATPSQQ